MRYQHWDELEQAVERFVAADGPNTGDLPADEVFALWARFEADRRESCAARFRCSLMEVTLVAGFTPTASTPRLAVRRNRHRHR